MKERWGGGVLEGRAQALRKGDEENGRQPGEPNRRELLRAGMDFTSLALATSLVGKYAYDKGAPSREKPYLSLVTSEGEAVPQIPEENQGWQERTVNVPHGLVGKRVPAMEWSYYAPTPLAGETPVSSHSLQDMLPPVAFHNNLAELFTRKSELIKGAPDEEEQLRLYHRLSREYTTLFEQDATRRMDLVEFRSLIEKEVNAMLEALEPSYGAIAHTYLGEYVKEATSSEAEAQNYERSLARVLEYMTKHITPDVMLAYIATELFPVPSRAMDALELLTENAGLEFIERIPALGDRLESTGIFQLTKMVCGPGGSVNNLVGVMQQRDLVPAELKDFTSLEDHLHAGFLFAVHNIVAMVQSLVKEGRYGELPTLLESVSTGSHGGNSTLFLEYLAGAHHRPTVAREVLGDWLADNTNKRPSARTRSLSSYCGSTRAEQQVGTYMEKSRQSFLHLKRRGIRR